MDLLSISFCSLLEQTGGYTRQTPQGRTAGEVKEGSGLDTGVSVLKNYNLDL